MISEAFLQLEKIAENVDFNIFEKFVIIPIAYTMTKTEAMFFTEVRIRRIIPGTWVFYDFRPGKPWGEIVYKRTDKSMRLYR